MESKKIHINRAMNYIVQHITEPLHLDKVASIAGFSKFHFHRIFKEYTGETVASFTKRVRLEHSAFLLIFYKDRTINDIALSSGFSNSQNFATAFKAYYHLSPSLYQQQKGCQGVNITDPQRVGKYQVEIIFLDTFHFIYQRRQGCYDNETLHSIRNNFFSLYPTKTYIGISWDNPEITPHRHCRFDYGYFIDRTTSSKEYLIHTIEPQTYAVLTTKQKNLNTLAIWDYLYTIWLPQHGYTPNALFCFEQISPNTQEQISFYLPIIPNRINHKYYK